MGCAREEASVAMPDGRGVIEFSRERPNALAGRLCLVEVRRDGTAVFRYTTKVSHLIYGKPGEELHSESGTAGAFQVISTSFEGQTASIRFVDIYRGNGRV